MIKIIFTKDRGINDKKDKEKFDKLVKIAKSTFRIFGINGRTEVLMFRKKHYGHTPDILIFVEEERDMTPEMERKIRENFDYIHLGINANVSIHKIFTAAADYSVKF